MDIYTKSLDDLIKDERKNKKPQGPKTGGIHNKLRNVKAGAKKGLASKSVQKVGQKAGAQKVAKVSTKFAPNRIRKTGRTLIVNPKNGRKQLNRMTGATKNPDGPVGAKLNANRRTVLQLKRKLRRAIKKKQQLQRSNNTQGQQAKQPAQKPAAFRAQQPAGRKPAQQQTRQARRPAQAPIKAPSAQAAKERRAQTLQADGKRTPKGPIEKRKLKVRNIDRNTVTTSDLKTLFSKCGPLFNCNFDMDEFGQYLGTVTLVFQDERDAARAIRDYNRAAIDNKVITVEYVTGSGRPEHVPRFKQAPPKKHAQKTIKKR